MSTDLGDERRAAALSAPYTLRPIGAGTAVVAAALAGLVLACKGDRTSRDEPARPARDQPPPAPAGAPPNTTPDAFIGRGAPTFVLGTAGDDRSDRAIAAQVEMIRNLLFAGARVVADDSIDVARGPAAWPSNPILYGGPHVNAILAELRPTLPFEMTKAKLALGGQILEGDEYRLIALIPARGPDDEGPGYPEFLLYAGTGAPGVAEINGVTHGPAPILVADAFGALVAGKWRRTRQGQIEAHFPGPPARRIPWRSVPRDLEAAAGGTRAAVSFLFPKKLPASKDEAEIVAAGMRGLETAVGKLQIREPAPISIYVYPDQGSKESLTGDAGHGRAVVSSRVVHVLRFDSSVGGGFEGLVAHEGTHVLTYEAWGSAGSALLGEGVAVWVSGKYGGTPLDVWKARIGKRHSVVELLGSTFRELPEGETYPVAGLLVEALVEKVGLPNLRDHLYGATASTWAEACEKAGSSPQALEQALAATLGR